MDWNSLLVPALIGLVSTLLMGRFLKKVILLVLDSISRRTENKVDDELVSTIKNDWKIQDTTIDGKDE